jgi:AbiEi antitoxin C-terminal domain
LSPNSPSVRRRSLRGPISSLTSADLVDDCNDDRLVSLLNGQPTAAWQRAAYLLHGGGARERGISLLDRCSNKATPKTRFAHSAIDNADPVWVAQYNLIDALVAPLQAAIGKA